ncbi:MAG: hypothetical protein AAGI17_07060 [Planctomycetota bacterium]
MRTSVLVAGAFCSAAVAQPVFTIDFSNKGNGDPFVNGEEVGPQDLFPPFLSINGFDASNNAAPLSIFDTDPAGPNAGGGDPDLLVGLGNALILQNRGLLDQTVPGIFDTADDTAAGGTISIDLVGTFRLLSIDLIDMNGGNGGTVTLTDSNGLTRVYDVPAEWTNDISTAGPDGFGTLDLTTLADQDTSDSPGVFATASEDAGFSAGSVVALDVFFVGSGGIDNIRIEGIVPTPGAAAIFGIAGLTATRRRR